MGFQLVPKSVTLNGINDLQLLLTQDSDHCTEYLQRKFLSDSVIRPPDSRAVDDHQMYSGGLVVGKASAFHPSRSRPPLS